MSQRKSKEELEDESALLIAKEIKNRATEEVNKYVKSTEFHTMVESLKRREREKMMEEISELIQGEREAVLAMEREKLQKEQLESKRLQDIMAENQIRIEEKQRQDYEDRLKADADRLAAVTERQQAEVHIHYIELHYKRNVSATVVCLIQEANEQLLLEQKSREQAAQHNIINRYAIIPLSCAHLLPCV